MFISLFLRAPLCLRHLPEEENLAGHGWLLITVENAVTMVRKFKMGWK